MSVIERLRAIGDDADFQRARDEMTVRALREGLVDVAFEDHDTPMGSLRVAATASGVVCVGLYEGDDEWLLGQIACRLSPRILRGSSDPLMRARRQLDEYFTGGRRDFDVPLDWTLTQGFRRTVLAQVARIPYGETRSYAAMAALAGSPRAVRAAGSALATNPLPIVVPCHRVVRSDGTLGRYGGGVIAKAALLELESGRGLPRDARFGDGRLDSN